MPHWGQCAAMMDQKKCNALALQLQRVIFPVTVKHILMDCTHLSAVPERYFTVDTLKELFETVDSQNIIAFIKDINFYVYHYI